MSTVPSAPLIAPELHGIQMLRGLGAAMVVAHHVLEVAVLGGLSAPNWLVTAGASGVDLFFVVSGCIMVHTSFRAGRPPLLPATFFVRRVTRIFPIYWLACAALLLLMHLRHANAGLLSGSILALLLLPGDTPIIPYSWTLDYELYFYILFTAALMCRSIIATVGVVIAAMAAILVLSPALPEGPWATFLADPIPAEFVAGMGVILAWRWSIGRRRRWPLHPVLALPALTLMTAAPAFVDHVGSVGLPGWPRVAVWGAPAALTVAAFLGVGAPRNTVQRLAIRFGDASYSVYLTHIFVMLGYRHVLAAAPIRAVSPLVVAPTMFLIACLLGILVHLSVEVPLMNLVRRLGDRRNLMQAQPWSA